MATVAEVLIATGNAIDALDPVAIEQAGDLIKSARRVYTVGLGGSAAHASHCACDLVKLGGIDAVCLVDNVAALTAGYNDDGDAVFSRMLARASFDDEHDALIIFSVGGGNLDVSHELVSAAEYAADATIAIVGRRGQICEHAGHVIQIQCADPSLVTYVAESVMPVIWHALIAGPLKKESPVWK